ncbi:MAG: hypothetical protein ACOVRP_11985 [Gemmatimonas sp.]
MPGAAVDEGAAGVAAGASAAPRVPPSATPEAEPAGGVVGLSGVAVIGAGAGAGATARLGVVALGVAQPASTARAATPAAKVNG